MSGQEAGISGTYPMTEDPPPPEEPPELTDWIWAIETVGTADPEPVTTTGAEPALVTEPPVAGAAGAALVMPELVSGAAGAALETESPVGGVGGTDEADETEPPVAGAAGAALETASADGGTAGAESAAAKAGMAMRAAAISVTILNLFIYLVINL